MSGWTTPKDLILHLAGKLTVRVSLLFIIRSCLASNSALFREELARSWNTSALVCLTSHVQVISVYANPVVNLVLKRIIGRPCDHGEHGC